MTAMKRILPLLLALLLLVCPMGALAADVVDYTADFYVADYAEVLSDEVEGLIVLNNDVLDKACGAQIVVVTVNTVGASTIENYAYTLFNEWGIGDQAKNNGLLILLAVQDGEYWLMPGKGLQDYLSAGELDEMATEHLLPYAQTGDFDTGIRQLFGACFEYVSVAYDAGVSLDDTLYYTWLQTRGTTEGGAKYLSEPVREMAVTADPEPVVEFTPEPEPVEAPREEGGFGFVHLIVILIILIVIFSGISRMRANRPGRGGAARRSAPPPPPPVRPRPIVVRPPVPPRPPMGGRPAPRPPMGGSRPGGSPFGGGSFGGRPMGGGASRGGSGGSFSRPSGGVSRPSSPRPSSGRSGGFGGGRSGGGGSSRGGGSGGSFRGGR